MTEQIEREIKLMNGLFAENKGSGRVKQKSKPVVNKKTLNNLKEKLKGAL